jgi:two-component system, NarL family, response regulator YdfI
VVADDCAEMLTVLSNILGEYFQLVAVVSNGDDLVRTAINLHPDVIVSDIDMPVQGGLEAMSALRSLGIEAPFVLLGAEKEGMRLLELGAAAYVHKFDVFADLLDAVLFAAKGEYFVSRSAVHDTRDEN